MVHATKLNDEGNATKTSRASRNDVRLHLGAAHLRLPNHLQQQKWQQEDMCVGLASHPENLKIEGELEEFEKGRLSLWLAVCPSVCLRAEGGGGGGPAPSYVTFQMVSFALQTNAA